MHDFKVSVQELQEGEKLCQKLVPRLVIFSTFLYSFSSLNFEKKKNIYINTFCEISIDELVWRITFREMKITKMMKMNIRMKIKMKLNMKIKAKEKVVDDDGYLAMKVM